MWLTLDVALICASILQVCVAPPPPVRSADDHPAGSAPAPVSGNLAPTAAENEVKTLLRSLDDKQLEKLEKLLLEKELNEEVRSLDKSDVKKVKPVKDKCPGDGGYRVDCGDWSPYRSIDGTCNNLEHGEWGSPHRAQIRLLEPQYSPGNMPRRASDGSFLPSARDVSQTLLATTGETDDSSVATLMMMQLGQFMDHDISETPGSMEIYNINGSTELLSCDPNQCDLLTLDNIRSDCYPITEAGTCTQFKRSEAFLPDNCHEHCGIVEITNTQNEAAGEYNIMPKSQWCPNITGDSSDIYPVYKKKGAKFYIFRISGFWVAYVDKCAKEEQNNGQRYRLLIQSGATNPTYVPVTAKWSEQVGGGYGGYTQTDVRVQCKVPREQGNVITSWLDLSQVYGSDEAEHHELRDNTDHTRGRMATTPNPAGTYLQHMLPYHSGGPNVTGCRQTNPQYKCFHAGDIRQNEQVGLTSMHTLLVRMHNFIEERLFELTDFGSGTVYDDPLLGERLFNGTRHILIGMWQHIVYAEYLPILLGDNVLKTFGLKPLTKKKKFKDYDPDVRGDIFNVFSTAAFRMGHSELKNMVNFINKAYDHKYTHEFNDIVFNVTTMYESPVPSTGSGVDSIILGLISASAGDIDGQFPSQITEHLFTPAPPNGKGFDLPALNIQRGRDHGLPGYGAWREKCGLSDDLDDIPKDIRKKVKELYSSTADMDLYPLAMNEKHVKGGKIGPTFSCLIALQFRQLKYGDRFFYETKDRDVGFSNDELAEIRKFSLARLICDTLDDVDQIQPHVMLKPDVDAKKVSSVFKGRGDNSKVSCDQIPGPDYGVFIDRIAAYYYY